MSFAHPGTAPNITRVPVSPNPYWTQVFRNGRQRDGNQLQPDAKDCSGDQPSPRDWPLEQSATERLSVVRSRSCQRNDNYDGGAETTHEPGNRSEQRVRAPYSDRRKPPYP